jgi:hypothetical protein
MQADELLAKLLFEMGQRLVKQELAITGTRRDVLQVSLEVDDPGTESAANDHVHGRRDGCAPPAAVRKLR